MMGTAWPGRRGSRGGCGGERVFGGGEGGDKQQVDVCSCYCWDMKTPSFNIRSSFRLSVRQSVRPFVRQSVRPSVRLYIRPSVRPYIRPSVRLSVRQSVRPSFRTSIRPSVCPSVQTYVQRFVCHSQKKILHQEHLYVCDCVYMSLCMFCVYVCMCVCVCLVASARYYMFVRMFVLT